MLATAVRAMELRMFSLQRLFEEIQLGMPALVLIDVRPTSQYSLKHILSAENLNLSKIVIRRLLKGMVSFKTTIQSSPSLLNKLNGTQRPRIVLYDQASIAQCPQCDLLKHAEVFWSCWDVDQGSNSDIYLLDGGLNAFETLHPELCTTSHSSCHKRPSAIAEARTSLSLSADLPSTRFQFSGIVRTSPAIARDTDDRYGPPVEILSHVVLGCEKDSSKLEVLQSLGITAVLNISHNCLNHFESIFEYMGIHIEDSYNSDLLSKLQKAFEFIDNVQAKGGKVFVHCYAGVSRSPALCIAYIMKMKRWSLSQAYDYIKSKRPHISPNLHFMGQLLAFQKQLESEAESENDSPRSTLSSCTERLCTSRCSSPLCGAQIHCISTPSVYGLEDAQVVDLSGHCSCAFESCKKTANKGLITKSSQKFPLTP